MYVLGIPSFLTAIFNWNSQKYSSETEYAGNSKIKYVAAEFDAHPAAKPNLRRVAFRYLASKDFPV